MYFTKASIIFSLWLIVRNPIFGFSIRMNRRICWSHFNRRSRFRYKVSSNRFPYSRVLSNSIYVPHIVIATRYLPLIVH